MGKVVLGISRDHSGSMLSIREAAARDFNDSIFSIKEASKANNQSTLVSVVEADSIVRRVVVAADINEVRLLNEKLYACGGMTPLFDSVGDLIEQFKASPDAANPDTSFIIMATTDGAENASRKYTARSLSAEIRALQETDRWTFVFRVPRGYSSNLTQLGIPAGNIREWDQTDRGVEAITVATRSAFATYYSDKAAGKTATKKFYADLSSVTSEDVETTLTDISPEVQLWPVSTKDNGAAIRDFVERRLAGSPLLKGAAFYQLRKTEVVQPQKMLIIRDKKTRALYSGLSARKLINIPLHEEIKLVPGQLGEFDVFVQSTSVNRKMEKGTEVLYWSKMGTPYKEGPSSKK